MAPLLTATTSMPRLCLRHAWRALLPLVIAAVAARPAAAGLYTVNIRTTRPVILNNGKEPADIYAEVRDSTGGLVPDGTQVTFTTNIGQFRPGFQLTATVGTQAGTARVQLVGQDKGTARVFASVPGGVSQTIEIGFTDNPADTMPGNAYVEVLATGTVAYDMNDRVIVATGVARSPGDTGMPGARLTYRNVDIIADSIQYDAKDNTIRASGNVHATRSGHHLLALRLFLPATGDGYAVIDSGKRLSRVKVVGSTLAAQPVDTPIAPHFFETVDLSQADQVVTARMIRLFPGLKLQFIKPKFYNQGQQIVSMPYYEMGLFSNQLFTDQIVSVGTQGLGMDLPLYYDLSPTSTGIFHVRHAQQLGRGSFATQPGWSLDMTEDYNSSGAARRYTGQFGFTGITRSDWGFQWNHNQEFSADTRGSFAVDFPQHRGVFVSSNLNRQLGPLQTGFNLTGNRTISGFTSSGSDANWYLETNPKKIGTTGYTMAFGTTLDNTRTRAAGFAANSTTETVQTRLSSMPFKVGRGTTLTNYLTIGNQWVTQGRSGVQVISSLAAMHTFTGGATLQMTYDFTHQPALIPMGGNHRLSTSFVWSRGDRWNVYLYNSTVLDAANSSTMGDLNYALAKRWRLTASITQQQFATAQYRDYQLGIARSISGRDVLVSYSTFNHRFFFDLQATRF